MGRGAGVPELLGRGGRLFPCAVHGEANGPCAADGHVFKLRVLAYQDEDRYRCRNESCLKGKQGCMGVGRNDIMTAPGPGNVGGR